MPPEGLWIDADLIEPLVAPDESFDAILRCEVIHWALKDESSLYANGGGCQKTFRDIAAHFRRMGHNILAIERKAPISLL